MSVPLSRCAKTCLKFTFTGCCCTCFRNCFSKVALKPSKCRLLSSLICCTSLAVLAVVELIASCVATRLESCACERCIASSRSATRCARRPSASSCCFLVARSSSRSCATSLPRWLSMRRIASCCSAVALSIAKVIGAKSTGGTFKFASCAKISSKAVAPRASATVPDNSSLRGPSASWISTLRSLSSEYCKSRKFFANESSQTSSTSRGANLPVPVGLLAVTVFFCRRVGVRNVSERAAWCRPLFSLA
mmetsp:Transcript_63008/g.163502  ORF Transcript_63008/g.163502 Transcript_63008/m.163502 type:complete len:249 (-) Transcript_63008:214-960(-)